MRLTKSLTLFLIACCLSAAPFHVSARQPITTLTVQVTFEDGSIPRRISARLYYPRATGKPPIVTVTDAGGRFKVNLPQGSYMLELYQGDTMCYQKVLAVAGRQRAYNIVLRTSGAR